MTRSGDSMRLRAKRDLSEGPIFDALRARGWTVQPVSIPHGPDAFASQGNPFTSIGRTIAIEVKTAKAKLRPGQERWRANWPGEYYILRTVEDVEALR